ncbi:MAG: EAL domain-containing protein, partial [Rhodocyclales bacterium]|nr:EAL domain-containing protein [Rhodocyclales bacterium]
TVIEGTILIAHKFGLRVIAEGVETEAQAATLTRLGVDEFQGYLYGRPSPDVEPWLRAQALPVTAHAAPQQG